MQNQNLREQRGRLICDLRTEVRRVDENEYAVKSQSGNGEYQVRALESGWTCSCPDAAFRGQKCKHQFAVEFSRKLRSAVELGVLADFNTTDKCIYCGSKHIVKDGQRHNKGADIQKFNCLDCRRYFTVNLGFEGMKHSPQAITQAMQLYFTGESLRNVQKFLRLQGVNVSHVTVLKWIRKYVGLMDEYLERLTPQVSDTWRADELWVKIKGDMKYLFAVMDDETRFWIAQEVADSKEKHDASRLFHQAWFNAGKAPATMITDGLRTYGTAYKKELGWRRHDVKQTHIREIALAGQVHNNKMERMNGEVRDRERTMRGLKAMNSPIIKGFQVYHNYIRPHEALDGETPADRAGIKVEGKDKWFTLIQNASHFGRKKE